MRSFGFIRLLLPALAAVSALGAFPQNAPRKSPAPQKPKPPAVAPSALRPKPTPPPPRPMPPPPPRPPVARPMTPEEYAARPIVTGVRHDSNGRVSGFHVVAPGGDENEFGGMQRIVNGIRGTDAGATAQPQRETVKVYRRKLAPPSSVEAERKEQEELSALLANPETLMQSVAFAPDVFEKNAMPLVKAFYREKDGEIVPAFSILVVNGNVAKTERPEAADMPVAEEATIRKAYEAGTVFRIVREHPLQLTCGMCGGLGRIPAERVTVEGQPGERIVEGKCPRCDGTGKNSRPVARIFDIRKP